MRKRLRASSVRESVELMPMGNKHLTNCCLESEPFKESALTPYMDETGRVMTDKPQQQDKQQATKENGGHPPRRRFCLRKARSKIKAFFQNIEEFLFPKSPLVETKPPAPRVRGGVLLNGCASAEEHYERIRRVIEITKKMHGEEGLAVIDLAFRLCPCGEHREQYENPIHNESSDDEDDEDDIGMSVRQFKEIKPEFVNSNRSNFSLFSNDGSFNSSRPLAMDEDLFLSRHSMNDEDFYIPNTNNACNQCRHNLFCGDTRITELNRKSFVADGDMYEVVSRLIQEYAHDRMIEEAKMKWVTVEESSRTPSEEPLRVLVDERHPILCDDAATNSQPTLLVCTGRGKVRAGIFSRKHLMCGSGLEIATAVPFVRGACSRGYHVVIMDPNTNGEAHGFENFQKTMRFLEDGGIAKSGLYILSHSASGGHLARYFLDRSVDDCGHLLNSIRAVAFTDSTHSVQWFKKDGQGHVRDFLESDRCIYFRSSQAREMQMGDKEWYLHPAGEPIQVDSFWKHRFGHITTCWAGTNDHSLTNWYAYHKIWEFFDKF